MILRDRNILKYVLIGFSCLVFGFLLGKSEYGDQIVYVTGVEPSQRNTPSVVIGNVSSVESIPNSSTNVNLPLDISAPITNKSGTCNVLNIKTATVDRHECLPTKWKPSFHICIHSVQRDIHVSGSIKRSGMWEAHVVKVFQKLLNKDPDLAVIDIGANIGLYSLLGTTMGRPVVAVEARQLHAQMIHHALILNHKQDADFVLLHNAVSDEHGTLLLQLTEPHNQGHTQVIKQGPGRSIAGENRQVSAIQLNDLLEVIHFEKAIMKIDIEGYEHKAMSACDKLLEKVNIPYIFMEWLFQKNMAGPQHIITNVLKKYDYQPFGLGGNALNWASVTRWPTDIIWKRNDARF